MFCSLKDPPRLVLVSFDNAVLLETLRTIGEAGWTSDLITTAPLRSEGKCRYLKRVFREASPEAVVTRIETGDWKAGESLLLPLDEAAVLWVSRIRQQLSAHLDVALTTPPERYRLGIHKAALARFLAQHSLPHPQTWFADNWSEVTDFPVIIKPVDQSFGAGLEICSDRRALAASVELRQNKGQDFVVQTLIKGYDIDCSVFCVAGKIHTWTIQREVEKCAWYSPPVTVEFVRQPRVLECVAALMALLGWEGVAHLDLRYDEASDRFLILEINGRFWGSMLASAAAGVNFIERIAGHWQGMHPAPHEQAPMRFRSRGTGIKALLLGQLEWRETMLPMILRDPVPWCWERLCQKTVKPAEETRGFEKPQRQSKTGRCCQEALPNAQRNGLAPAPDGRS